MGALRGFGDEFFDHHVEHRTCGVSSSIAKRNRIPNRKPTAAGMTAHSPLAASASIAGMSSDHTEAATITPEANPSRAFCKRTGISSFIRKTNPDPIIVPSRGINKPRAFTIGSFISPILLRCLPRNLWAQLPAQSAGWSCRLWKRGTW